MKNTLDKFYTKPKIVDYCYNLIKHNNPDMWLEPSAGDGAFFNKLPDNKIGIDIQPEHPDIIKHDFLTYYPPYKNIYTIGNPPFGKNSSLAVKFFNHAAKFSNNIAFILPRTFMKSSIQNRLDNNFHLEYQEVLPNNSFLFNGKDYNVPTVFQIWSKQKYKRTKTVDPTTHKDFEFVKKSELYDFAIQRVGVNAGRIKMPDINLSEQSHYFIQSQYIDIFEQIDFDSVKYNCAGNPSISKTEIVKLFDLTKNQT